jgi:hypothetical protein
MRPCSLQIDPGLMHLGSSRLDASQDIVPYFDYVDEMKSYYPIN